jgi:hypothetical protein
MKEFYIKEEPITEPSGKCPYWDLESKKECGLTMGVMYIPMPEHMRTFCLSSRYHQCRRYIHGCELAHCRDEFNVNDFMISRDRRRLRRYPEHIHLDLVVCDRNNSPQLMNACKAESLDISLGGLRLESCRELNPESIVSFVMDPDFSNGSLLGVGEVKWCRRQNNSNKFETGIAFSNYSTSESVREYLDFSQN